MKTPKYVERTRDVYGLFEAAWAIERASAAPPVPAATPDRFRRLYNDPRTQTVCCNYGVALVGLLMFRVRLEHRHEIGPDGVPHHVQEPGRLEVLRLRTAPEYRGLGVGRETARHLDVLARHFGAAEVVAFVPESWLDGLAWMRRRGFVADRDLRRGLFGADDGIVMRRPTPAAPAVPAPIAAPGDPDDRCAGRR